MVIYTIRTVVMYTIRTVFHEGIYIYVEIKCYISNLHNLHKYIIILILILKSVIFITDRTCYPVASTNTKDFYNLVNVYLDAVLNPRAINDDKVLQQEVY